MIAGTKRDRSSIDEQATPGLDEQSPGAKQLAVPASSAPVRPDDVGADSKRTINFALMLFNEL